MSGGQLGNAINPVGLRDQREDRQALQREALATGVGGLALLLAATGNLLDRRLRGELSGYDRYTTLAGKADTVVNSRVRPEEVSP
jgi:hypothetical protein